MIQTKKKQRLLDLKIFFPVQSLIIPHQSNVNLLYSMAGRRREDENIRM
jgi:hypothetical protein